ncbi:MAG: hypothetical protein D6731_16370 [Planctomycetota bacterium]|nr:MAG: hypothetical protein D6731_16370 [Planctomycetota bacterium]
MAKRKRDSGDDDLGFRTPTRRPLEGRRSRDADPRAGRTGAEEPAQKKRETGRRKRETGSRRRETGRRRREGDARGEDVKARRETGRRKGATGSRPAVRDDAAPARRGRAGLGPLPLALGLLAAVAVGGLVVSVMLGGNGVEGGTTATDVRPRETVRIRTEASPHPRPTATPAAAQRPSEASEGATVAVVEGPAAGPTEEVPPPSAEPEGDALEKLAARSSTHAAIARLLEDYRRLFDPSALPSAGPLLEQFRERQRREQELIEQLRAMGPAAVGALKDMILGLDARQYRIFLGKALAGMEGPDALSAVAEVLGQVKDVALQTTLARFLPETPDAAATLASAIQGEQSGNLRTMLLREYNRRVGPNDPSGADLLRRLALEDPDPNVRAEAVTILGRRGDPSDQTMMEQIISQEKNLSIRQRAIVSYAETGRTQALPFLEQLARNPDTSLPVRASAVLAIGRVGGPQAIQSLDLIAQTDPSQEIRTRANRLAQSLRRRAQDATEPKRMQRPPMRIDPAGGGVAPRRP